MEDLAETEAVICAGATETAALGVAEGVADAAADAAAVALALAGKVKAVGLRAVVTAAAASGEAAGEVGEAVGGSVAVVPAGAGGWAKGKAVVRAKPELSTGASAEPVKSDFSVGLD